VWDRKTRANSQPTPTPAEGTNVQNNQHQYAPGDIANGHVLTESGQWLPVGEPTPPTESKVKKPIYKRWWAIALAAVFVISAISQAMGGESDPAKAKADAPAVSAPVEEPKAEEPPVSEKPAPAPVEKPKPAPKPSVVKVDAGTMLAEFEGNEAAADAKYKGKTVAVTGIVEKVDTEFWDDEQYTIQLSDGNDYAIWTVNCNDVSADVAAKVQPGSKVTVRGTFDDGGDLGVEVKDCTLA